MELHLRLCHCWSNRFPVDGHLGCFHAGLLEQCRCEHLYTRRGAQTYAPKRAGSEATSMAVPFDAPHPAFECRVAVARVCLPGAPPCHSLTRLIHSLSHLLIRGVSGGRGEN